MAHSNEETLRAAYAAFAQGDLNGYLQYCTDNITFRVPGKGKIAGTHKRDQFVSPWVSGVIELTRRHEHVQMRNEKDFFLLVKTAFNQRRKKMRNAVRNLFSEDILHDETFDKRAEQLSIDDFAMLTFKMNSTGIEKEKITGER